MAECKRCGGSGEIDTRWDKYGAATHGCDCPDCLDGIAGCDYCGAPSRAQDAYCSDECERKCEGDEGSDQKVAGV